MSELTSNGVQIYHFPTDDESVADTNKTMNVGYLPSISTRIIFPWSYINLCQCLSVVDRAFKPRLGKTKDYKIGIYCFLSKEATLRSKTKSKVWLGSNQDNVSKWSGATCLTCRLLKSCNVCWSSSRWTSLSHWNVTCSLHDIIETLLTLFVISHKLDHLCLF